MGPRLLGIPVIDHWWQTETGWAIAANPMGLEPMEAKPGSPTVPMPGYDLHVVDPSGEDVPPARRRDRPPAAAAPRLPAHLVG